MATKTQKLIPQNISDTGTLDDDSGLRLFRGSMSPWDKLKSFKETYNFALRHAALFAVGWTNALRIIEPDYEKRQTAMSTTWGDEMKVMWSESDDLGIKAMFRDRFAIPPFIKDGIYLAANYCDKGDEQTLISGHIWYASNDRMEKEIHTCAFDICGPEACDVSQGGGQHFCAGLAGQKLNNYNPERRGCGDPYCHALIETVKKYGEHPNASGYEWEHWGPPASGMRKEGVPRKTEVEFLNTGVYTAPSGANFTAGEIYKDYTQWPMAYSTQAIGGMRAILKDKSEKEVEMAWHIVNTMFDAAGKFQFGEWNTRKEAREWLGVPESIDDGRVLGGYISMILQARSLPWKFSEFSEKRVVIETDKTTFEMFGQYPELTPAYVAYFDGIAKTLVSAEWIVRLDDSAPEGALRFMIQRGTYGFRRQKPGYDYGSVSAEPKNLLSTDKTVKAQHEAIRKTAGWYDFTHKLLEVAGANACAFLDSVFVSNIASLKTGGARYTTMLNDDGIIIDDVIVFRLEENKYWVSTLYINEMIAWFDIHKDGKNVAWENITESWAMYSVQGPASKDILNSLLAEKIDSLKFFTIADNKIDGVPVKVARSGYTGEKLGYEIYIAPENTALLTAKLAEKGKALGAMEITKVDIMAYSLAAEKGLILMTDVLGTNPFEVGFEGTIKWDKDFIGKAALEKIRAEGAKRKLLGFTVDDESALIYGGPHGAPVKLNGEVVGRVTKFTHGFTIDKNIGYALVETAKVKTGDIVTINGYKAVLTERQFVK